MLPGILSETPGILLCEWEGYSVDDALTVFCVPAETQGPIGTKCSSLPCLLILPFVPSLGASESHVGASAMLSKVIPCSSHPQALQWQSEGPTVWDEVQLGGSDWLRDRASFF